MNIFIHTAIVLPRVMVWSVNALPLTKLQTVPVVNKRNHEADIASSCCCNNVVKSLKTVRTSIDGRSAAAPNLVL